MKNLLLTIVGAFVLSTMAIAQSVPTNGLVAWYPFNGNANDASGNGNNGVVSGATLTTDRFGNVAKAYSFYGIDDYINVQTTNMMFDTQNYTMSFWFKSNESPTSTSGGPNVNPSIISRLINGGPSINNADNIWTIVEIGGGLYHSTNAFSTLSIVTGLLNTNWHNMIYTKNMGTCITYLDGQLWSSTTVSGSAVFNSYPIRFGRSQHTYWKDFTGELDDIGFWNRALTPQEVTGLYNGLNCANDLIISPQNNQLQIGAMATFIATTSDANPSFIWQSDFGQGFQTLNNYGNYLGVNTSTLSISNIHLSNHNQPIRAISTAGSCIDTSNVALITLIDTCINTVNDTVLISVTDTLIINAAIAGLNPPNNINNIKIFPNPASSHITIDYGNFALMNGYILKITNSQAQVVFVTAINQQSSYIDLSSWSGNGIYFIQIIDTQNNVVENRKVVLQ